MLQSQRSFQIETVIFPSGSWKRGLMGTVGALIVVPLNLQFSGAEAGIPINIYLTIINFFSLMEYFGCSFIIPSSLQSSYNIVNHKHTLPLYKNWMSSYTSNNSKFPRDKVTALFICRHQSKLIQRKILNLLFRAFLVKIVTNMSKYLFQKFKCFSSQLFEAPFILLIEY